MSNTFEATAEASEGNGKLMTTVNTNSNQFTNWTNYTVTDSLATGAVYTPYYPQYQRCQSCDRFWRKQDYNYCPYCGKPLNQEENLNEV